MSRNGDAPAQSSTQNSNFIQLSIMSKEKFIGPNYMGWMRNLKMNLRYENKEHVIEKPLVGINESNTTQKEIISFNKHSDDVTKVACIMVATITPEIQKFYKV